MKVLNVIPFYYPAFQFGGPIFAANDLNKTLVKKGVDVTVYTTNVGLGNKVPVNQEIDVEGVKVYYFKFTKLFEFLGTTGWQFSLPLTRALKKSVKNFDIISIVGIWNYPVAITSYYCRKYKKPYIISPIGCLYPVTIKHNFLKKMLYYHFVVKGVLKYSSKIKFTTADEAEHCYFKHKNKGLVAPNGIIIPEGTGIYNLKVCPKKDYQIKQDSYSEDKKVILFLGRITWKKGLDILIDAYSMLIKERKDIHLLIVGKDDGDGYEKKVKGWVKKNNIESHVTFTGMLTGEEKLKVISQADIFVLPSYSENFGVSVVEAMAYGVPVVISNRVGIYREVEKNKAGIIVETNPESLYKGIKTLLDDESLSYEIAENGNKLAKEYYDINKVAERTIEVYEEILKCNVSM